MEYKGPMLVIKDIQRTKAFYTEVLGLGIISDLGANVTFTGGISVQTESSWIEFTGSCADSFKYKGNDAEMYFEEEDFQGFMDKIKNLDVEILGGGEIQMPWGQRVVRLYDPDGHIMEIGESFPVMLRRMRDSGMSMEEMTQKTFMPKEVIEAMMQ